MKIREVQPPRKFEVGRDKKTVMSDCAHIELAPDEQVTFLGVDGTEYDVARKSWGFYATPSTNSRLKKFNVRAVLVHNEAEQYFVLLVEPNKITEFTNYLATEKMNVVAWLDDDAELTRLKASLR